MKNLVSLAETPESAARLVAVGHAIGAVLDLAVVSRSVDAGCATDELVSELGGRDVGGIVLAAGGEPSALWWSLAPELSTPVVLLPPGVRDPGRAVRRALVPLDGSRATTNQVADLVTRLETHGVTVRLLHVFDDTTVPGFWDQAGHAGRLWEAEFRERHGVSDRDLVLLRGSGPRQIVGEADRWGADLVVLGWKGRLAGDSAAVVRRAVLRGRAPVMLVNPVAAGPTEDKGPKAR